MFIKTIILPFLILLLCYSLSASAGHTRLHPLRVSSVNIQNPGYQPVTTRSPRARCRPGPKPKPLSNRVYKPRGPIKRVRRTYSRERKIEVLLFLIHHRVPPSQNSRSTEYRRPTNAEAASYWKIPENTIQEWWKKQDEILGMKSDSRRNTVMTWRCAWPEMEEELFQTFIAQREAGRLVRRGWFRRTATALFKKHYATTDAQLFVFTAEWFNGFLRRWNISCQALTKKTSKVPEEYRPLVINWLRFNRRNSQPRNSLEQASLISDIGCYRLSNILNLDETPIPFEYLDGKTYDIKGSRTIGGKTDRSGWDKRQATLILYIFADGISQIKPEIIFHAKTGDGIVRRESHKWSANVTVEFNETAYNNENLFKQFIHEELLPALNTPYPIVRTLQPTTPLPLNQNPTHLSSSTRSLLLMDMAAFHITDSILATLRENNIVPSIISDPKRPVRTIVRTMGRQSGQSGRGFQKPESVRPKPQKPADAQARPTDAQAKLTDVLAKPADAQVKPADAQAMPPDAQAKPADA